jgi:hypothetical protein
LPTAGNNAIVLAMQYGGIICVCALLASSCALAQSNPVPLVNQPLVPMTLPPGGSSFTLTVNGTGFVSGSVVNWNGTPLATTFVSGSQLTATVPASDIASAGTAWVTVVTPGPGGGKSNVQYFDISNTATTLTFTQLVPFARLGPSTFTVNPIVADFNGDGKLDIAYSPGFSQGTLGGPPGGMFVQLGNGDGSFQPQLTVAATIYAAAAVAGDFNGDGKLDLAIATVAVAGSTSGVLVFLGNGDGTFQPPLMSATVAYYPVQIVVGDFNRDGKLDIAIGGSSSVSILLGNGDGTFQPPVNYPTSAAATAMAVGDFNGDGYLDLVYLGQYCCEIYQQLSFMQGNGDGTFQPPVSNTVLGSYFSALVAADINGDGKLDLIASDSTDSPPTDGGAWAWLGNGDGTFQNQTEYATGSQSTSLAVQDFNGDDQLDVVLSNYDPDDFLALLGNGNGTFQNPISFPVGALPTTALAGDFNGDGKIDLAFANNPSNAIGDLAVFLQGDWPVANPSPTSLTFAQQTVGTIGPPQVVTLANTGSAVLAVSSIGTSGTNAGDFAETNNCPTSLAPSASCQINATFTPQAAGNLTASLSVTDNAPGATQTVALTGVGVDFSVAPSGSSSATVTAGQTATYKLAVAPVGAFAQTVALTCSGAPQKSTCSLSPSSVVLNGSASTSVTVSVTTAGSSASLVHPLAFPPVGGRIELWLALCGVSGLVLLGGYSRKSRGPRFCALALLCTISIGAICSSCGGSASSGPSPGPPPTTSGTPAGSYSLTVTGTFTSGSHTLTHSTKLNLVVAQ